MNNLYQKINHTDSKKGLLGAVLATGAASVCCIGPLVVLGFGVGGAWASSFSFFEPVRPYLMAVTVGFLGYSFYRIYWKAKTEECEPGVVCATPRGDRVNKISLWSVTILISGLLAVPYLVPSVHAQSGDNLTANTKTVTLNVAGLTCSSCENAFVMGATSVEGVTSAQADHKAGQAVISYDSTKVSLDQVLAGTEKLGYQSKLKKPQTVIEK